MLDKLRDRKVQDRVESGQKVNQSYIAIHLTHYRNLLV
jgi:hypothetical protein